MLILNPFASSGLEPDERQSCERAFLDTFDLAASSEDPAEQDWAHGQLVEQYSNVIAGADDLCPSYFETMVWASTRVGQPD